MDATGWTPLADAIKMSGETLKENTGGKIKNVVYIVSDGLETCGGDPAKEAKALQQDGISATVNIIGFDVNNTEQQSLKKVAEAGGGTFTAANSKKALERYFKSEYQSLSREWLDYSIKTYLDIGEQRSQKYRELRGTKDEFVEKQKREKENIRAAVDYLKEQEKDQGIRSDIGNRWSKIHSYFWGKYRKLDREIFNNSQEENNKVSEESRKQRDEIRDKIDGYNND